MRGNSGVSTGNGRRRRPPRWFFGKARTYENLRVGKPHAYPTMSAHVRGVNEGNKPQQLFRNGWVRRLGDLFRGRARRSTGVSPKRRNPIDPRSPNISPP